MYTVPCSKTVIIDNKNFNKRFVFIYLLRTVTIKVPSPYHVFHCLGRLCTLSS